VVYVGWFIAAAIFVVVGYFFGGTIFTVIMFVIAAICVIGGIFDRKGLLDGNKSNQPFTDDGKVDSAENQSINKEQEVRHGMQNCEEVEVKVPAEINGFPMAYRYNGVDVCILRGKEPNFALLELGMKVDFVPEPENTYDSNAVIVKVGGIEVGYLYKGVMQDMVNNFILWGWPIFACIVEIKPGEKAMKMFMAFYKEKGAD